MISLCAWCVLVVIAYDFIRVLCERAMYALDSVVLYPLLSSKRTDYVLYSLNSAYFAPIVNKTIVSNVRTHNETSKVSPINETIRNTRENSPFR